MTKPYKKRRDADRLTCDQMPGWSGGYAEAAALLGVARTSVYSSVVRGTSSKGFYFCKAGCPRGVPVLTQRERLDNDLRPSIRDLTDEQIIARGRAIAAAMRHADIRNANGASHRLRKQRGAA